MGKRGTIFILFLLFLYSASLVEAIHSPSVAITPLSIYETNTANFTITVSNGLLSLNSINSVNINAAGFTMLSAFDITDWLKTIASNSVRYNTTKGGISNWGSQNFAIEAKAPKVDANQTNDWTITTEDYAGSDEDTIIQITIINDNTAPILAGPIPYNGMYIKNGTADQLTTINATDPETGVKQVNFNWADCDELNESHTSILTANGNAYSGTVDLSAYDDGTEICFSFNAENNGGELAYYSGILTIDGKAPIVALVAPADGSSMNAQSQFEFNATDNLAPTLDCSLNVDGTAEAAATANNGEVTVVGVANISEGKHEWSVTCIDLAGWIASSDTWTYILDRTPPNITLISPADGAIIPNGTIIEIEITDNFNFSNASYEIILNGTSSGAIPAAGSSIQLDTSDWPDGDNFVVVYADDMAGNSAEEGFGFTIDRTPPTVTLIRPEDGNESDVHVDFTFDATDNYDEMLDCELYIDTSLAAGALVNGSTAENIISNTLSLGNHTWKVSCTDDAGHTGTSETWGITIVDLSGPDIIIEAIDVIVRGNDVNINSQITDVSDVDSAYAVLTLPDGSTVNVPLTRAGDDFFAVYTTDANTPTGDYTVTIYANDTVGNPSSASEDFMITYAYVVDLTLNPNSVDINTNVVASGTVAYDNGSDVPENDIELILIGVNATTPIVNGTFSHQFTAPGSPGAYGITAQLTAGNGITFSDTETLNVNQQTINDDGGPRCRTQWECTDWGDCVGGMQERECNKIIPGCIAEDRPIEAKQCEVDDGDNFFDDDGGELYDDECQKDSDCGDGRQCNNGKCIGQQTSGLVSWCGDLECDSNEDCNKCPEDCGQCEDDDGGDAIGVGKATGFFSLENLKSTGILWILLLLAVILLTMGIVSSKDGKDKKDKMGLNKYLKKRLK